MTCVFCKIIKREVQSDIVYENDYVVVFKDINPQAPIHLLVVPKKHIDSIASEGSEGTASELIKVAKKIAQNEHIPGYKLLFCVGKEGGQTVNHLHLHLLAGERMRKKEVLERM